MRTFLAVWLLLLNLSPSRTHIHSLTSANGNQDPATAREFRSAAVWHGHVYLMGLLESPPLVPTDESSAGRKSITTATAEASTSNAYGWNISGGELSPGSTGVVEGSFVEPTELVSVFRLAPEPIANATQPLLNRTGRLRI